MELYQALITLDGWTFLAQICNLMIQLFIFKKFLLNPVKNVIAGRKAKADSQIADATKLRTLTDWKPQYTFEQGLAETIEFLRGNLDQYKVGQYIL